MDRQLFSHTTGVFPRRSRAAVPASIALHVAAVGAALALSSARRVNSAPPEPPRPPLMLRVGAAPGPKVPVPKGDGRPRAPKPVRIRPAAAPAAPKPFVEPPANAAPVVAPEPALDPLPPSDVADVATVPTDGLYGTGGSPDGTGPIGGPEPGNGSSGPGTGASAVRISEIEAPRRLHYVAPTYPTIAVRARLEGDVVLDCTIGVDGVVRDVRILGGLPLFHAAARDAVLRWVYTPTRLNGQPVSVLLTVTVRFRVPR
jgi:periplasmic protein TonB